MRKLFLPVDLSAGFGGRVLTMAGLGLWEMGCQGGLNWHLRSVIRDGVASDAIVGNLPILCPTNACEISYLCKGCNLSTPEAQMVHPFIHPTA